MEEYLTKEDVSIIENQIEDSVSIGSISFEASEVLKELLKKQLKTNKMKTFSKNQKVTHVDLGKGIVKKLRYNDTQGYIDFEGIGLWMRADNPYIQHGVNSYTPNTYTLDEIKQAIAMTKGEACNGVGDHSEGGRIALDEFINRLTK